ncbi:DUF6301 family protein [Nocardia sp. NPDC004151]|uniref:DUF6301 family protein n=1 Tax=Nocardia sp. NPDC004151 TaxID=3364304 RepID=UPI0036964977
MHTDLDGAVHIACLVADFDWTWAMEDVQRFSDAAGWTVVGQLPREHGADLRTGLDLQDTYARAIYGRAFLEREGFPDQLVTEILVPVTDWMKDTTPERHRSLTNAFAELSDRLVAALGRPTKPRPGVLPEVRWTLSTAVLTLRMNDQSVELRIVNPVHQQWWDSWVAHDDEDEPVADTADEDLEALPDRPRSWPEFSSALTLTLNRLRSDEQLVLTMGQEGIAQFEMDWFKIGCFVRAGMSGGAVQPIPHADRAVMTANNWHAGAGPNEGWWERTMRWPARYEEFEAAADAVSLALRDIIGIGSPTDLQVTGWNNASDYSYPDITAFGVHR